ncbi:MAG: methyl-accepting chemotaxis protein, partial [Pseudomonadota bacterium]|nr:methyl-accepting chemotaxis protein [Pseudomonadota bacterium]
MTSVRRLFTYLFLLLFVESLVLGFIYSTLITGVVTGLLLLSLPLWMLHQYPTSKLTAHVVAAGCMMFSFLHIQQSYGLIEVHFEIFILMAVLIMFVEWRVFITALAFVAVHHLSFYFLQINEVGLYVFDPDRLYFSTVLIHAVY